MLVSAVLLAAAGVAAVTLPVAPEEQRKQYDADVPKTVVELQQFRQTSSIRIPSPAGKEGTATLINLNPAINVWYLLRIERGPIERGDAAPEWWHLENPKPRSARLLLDEKFPSGIVIAEGNERYRCELHRGSPLIYEPLCDGRVFLRNPTKGHRTALEIAAEFLRERVWGGEQVVDLFHHLMADRYREEGEFEAPGPGAPETSRTAAGRPEAALIDPLFAAKQIKPWNLGIALDPEGPETNGMTPGAWYAAAAGPGVYVSVLQPNFIAPAILQSYKNLVSSLDIVEASSLCYLVAFDLSRFDLGFEMGTDHPAVNWSGRVPASMRDARLPGPDGIGSIAPLIATGLIRPDEGRQTVAAFTGGFKRTHGAFRFGDLALQNHGSHYGFIENGVVLSKLQPGLATVYVLDDGSVDMKTWTEADNRLLGRVRHARQNGVPLVEFDEAAHMPAPGQLVNRWGPGNWSGSGDERLRTIRAGLALTSGGGRRFLIYAVFSDATPSAMARVFQACRARYAMLLDMNALEHTYLAVYRRSGSELIVDHLLKGMNALDKSASNEPIPRFLGYADNREFFYLMRRGAAPDTPRRPEPSSKTRNE